MLTHTRDVHGGATAPLSRRHCHGGQRCGSGSLLFLLLQCGAAAVTFFIHCRRAARERLNFWKILFFSKEIYDV